MCSTVWNIINADVRGRSFGLEGTEMLRNCFGLFVLMSNQHVTGMQALYLTC